MTGDWRKSHSFRPDTLMATKVKPVPSIQITVPWELYCELDWEEVRFGSHDQYIAKYYPATDLELIIYPEEQEARLPETEEEDPREESP